MKVLNFKTFFFLFFFSFSVWASDYALISIGNNSNILVGIADNQKEREKGLMFLDKLTNSNGLLLLYPESKIINIWMHNTVIPLDIIFIGENYKVLSIKEGIPMSKKIISSEFNVNAILEIPKGCSKKLNIKKNDIITWTVINKEKKEDIRYYHCLDN